MVTLLVAVAAVVSVGSVASDSVTRWRPYSEAAAERCRVPVAWIERVMRVESAGLTMLGGRPITSRAGAMGLMQLMPATWAMMQTQLALGGDPHDPRDNILAVTCYLRAMYNRFDYPGLFAAYNAGPGRYAEHLATGSALPSETRVYLAKITGNDARSVVTSAAPSVSIFFALRTSPTAAESPAAARPSGIFVTLGSEASPR